MEYRTPKPLLSERLEKVFPIAFFVVSYGFIIISEILRQRFDYLLYAVFPLINFLPERLRTWAYRAFLVIFTAILGYGVMSGQAKAIFSDPKENNIYQYAAVVLTGLVIIIILDRTFRAWRFWNAKSKVI